MASRLLLIIDTCIADQRQTVSLRITVTNPFDFLVGLIKQCLIVHTMYYERSHSAVVHTVRLELIVMLCKVTVTQTILYL